MLRKTLICFLGTACLWLAPATNAHAFGEPVSSDSSWNGFYAGGHAGYEWFGVDGLHDNADGQGPGILSAFDLDDGLVGVQGGYDHQRGQYVIGIAGDFSWVNKSDSFNGPDNDLNVLRSELDTLASVRARLGIIVQNILFFGTVGVGFADYEFSVSEPNDNPPGFSKVSFNESGLVIGGGAEVKLRDNLTLSFEYLHYDVGARADLFALGVTDTDPGDFVKFDDIDVVRVGLNYRFGGQRSHDVPLK